MECKDAAYCYRCSVVCDCVCCLLDMTMNCATAKTAELIEVLFGVCGFKWAQETMVGAQSS